DRVLLVFAGDPRPCLDDAVAADAAERSGRDFAIADRGPAIRLGLCFTTAHGDLARKARDLADCAVDLANLCVIPTVRRGDGLGGLDLWATFPAPLDGPVRRRRAAGRLLLHNRRDDLFWSTI